MILADTSIWIEFLRGTTTAATLFVRERVDDLATTEPILLELLAGAQPGARTAQLERMLASQPWIRVDPHLDYRAAVDVYQRTRSTGHQPRALHDCLIGAVALRVGVPVAHRDIDYEHIAAATGLPTIDLRE